MKTQPVGRCRPGASAAWRHRPRRRSLPPGRAAAAGRSVLVPIEKLASGPARRLRGMATPAQPAQPLAVALRAAAGPGGCRPSAAGAGGDVTRQTPLAGNASHPQTAAGADVTLIACRAPLLYGMPTYFSLLRLVNQWVILHNPCGWADHLIADMSRDQPRAHEFTKYIGLPTPAPWWAFARARRWLYQVLPDRVAVLYL